MEKKNSISSFLGPLQTFHKSFNWGEGAESVRKNMWNNEKVSFMKKFVRKTGSYFALADLKILVKLNRIGYIVWKK